MPAHCLLKEALNVKRGRGRPRTTITVTLRTVMKELACGDWEEVVAPARDKKTWRLRCGRGFLPTRQRSIHTYIYKYIYICLYRYISINFMPWHLKQLPIF